MPILSMLQELDKELEKYADGEKSEHYQRFFKTGKGQYGEGDIFLGLIVPETRKLANKFKDLEMKDIEQLIISPIHEKRLISLLILIEKFKKADEQEKQKIFDFYIKNAKKVNNWDLVDLSAPNISGNFLLDKDRSILYELAKSENLWEKRISIISTFSFIRNNELQDTIKISEMLLEDKHDLIHKAVGWMLREIGKRNEEVLVEFLSKHYKNMPRTMLRYSIEKFDEQRRQAYLRGEI